MASRTETLLHDEATNPPAMGTYPSAANQRFPKGTIVTRDASGRAVSPSTADASGFPAVGVSKAYFLNATGDEAGGAAGDLDVEVSYGVKGFAFTGTTPLPGDDMFVVDNQTISTDSSNGTRGSAGKCTEVRTMPAGSKCFIEMGPTVAKNSGTGSVASVLIPLNTFHLSTGAPMAVFADAASPTFGLTVLGSESLAIRWNNDAAPGTAFCSVAVPRDLDESRDAVLEFLVSKSGATLADATTLTVTAFVVAVGDLYDADADAGGVTGAVVGNAVAKTTALLTRTLAAADIPSGARTLTFSVKPTAGTLGTDDFFIHEARLRFVRK